MAIQKLIPELIAITSLVVMLFVVGSVSSWLWTLGLLTAFGFSITNGYHGSIELFLIPIDLVTSVVMYIIAAFLSYTISPYFFAIGNGALASFMITLGIGIGDSFHERKLTKNKRQ